MTSVEARPTASPRPALRTALRLWPIALGLLAGSMIWGVDTVTATELMPVLPLVYVAAVTIGRRSVSWPLLGLGTACFVVVRAQDALDPVLVLGAVGLVVVALGAALGRRRELALQTFGLVLWLGLVLLATVAAPGPARLLMAVAWAGHGAWDLWHLRRDTAVSRSYATWCGVFDIVMAIGLVAAG